MDDYLYFLPNVDPTSDKTAQGNLGLPGGYQGQSVQPPVQTTVGFSDVQIDQINNLISAQIRTLDDRIILAGGLIQSQNFVTGVSGWQIDSLGNCEFGNGVFRGTITATGGTIGGFTIGATTVSATGLSIDSATPKITVGTGSNAITLNGSTGIISSNSNLWQLNGDGTTVGIVTPSYQRISYFSSTNSGYAIQQTTSETDGSVVYIASRNTTGSTATISRFLKDTITSQYYCTHSITTTRIFGSGVRSLAVLGTNLYLFSRVGGTPGITRFSSADLTSETNMTISGTGFADGSSAWSDGTDLYAYESSGIFRQYSVSGTTATNVTTITYTSSGVVQGAVSDNTSVWLTDSTEPLTIRKYPVTGGSSTSNISIPNLVGVYVNQDSTHLILMKSTVLGLVFPHTENSPTAVVGIVDELMPISAP